ncbi:recombinase family protein [Streptomyces sp. NPDC090741]|uniref:recombinase family protein n=1 Tax=Streptomyces sp. NPDC090741 TaxID=3365967 RepID=UPI0037F1A9F8
MTAETLPRRGCLTGQVRDPAAGARALLERRTAQLAPFAAAVLEARSRPCVDVYVLLSPGQEPGVRAAFAEQTARARGWNVARVICDTTGSGTDPALRPALATALDRIARGKSAGLVAVSRADISGFDDEYAAVLDRLRDVGGFLDLAHPETAL